MIVDRNIARIRGSVLAVAASTLLFTAAVSPTIANAADEDTSASVYLVFDPETGDFVTVHDPDGQALATETQESIDSTAPTDVAAAPAGGQAASTSAAGGTMSPTLIIGILAVAAVLAAVMFMQRRRSAS
jgi:hypothetical protein